MYKLIYSKKVIIITAAVVLFIFSQWLAVKLVYNHKINGAPAKFLASLYNLKAGVIEEEEDNVYVYLKDFFENYEFANRLLTAQAATNEQFANLQQDKNEISELVWSKLLKQAWLKKVAIANDIAIKEEDVNYYMEAMGGQEKVAEAIKSQGISMEEYRYFLIEPDLLEALVYNYFLANFEDERGVSKIQEAYMFLESESGANWEEVVTKYGEDEILSGSTFWLSEEELVDVYEPIKEVGEDGFSKIVQVPGGYIIWHVNSIVEEDDKKMWEMSGIFVYAQGIDDFFDTYLNSVEVTRKY
ncbi:MAG: hypothetical protein A2406_04380 [Candidatus Komeilibacteria bacterium RIFOXYC1_FULL_37_11]|uniref:Uncharacterized protein n=1 Tax=Candidatus Komeilibacteria bacterium RIFOXYC1_FULL_37_11 TaxID=1798555 RepID=A0A1G2C065_9BACT|nr:MAG: hypothetical protein A2406_04380 [Candidatus Komeilibacteria bacterium RIFOXYC1_FULL_37_11]OGY96047.1 MAG: hypothetical protein A2611_04445 [Candidatus Komeilibacteria bacterium RIFOXYD1_FULL_37_29]OGY96725.1 MAG: hypothetical protein A2543_01455 [Candidatus Komeilibacteria bacterium RIFOXYD2_FULL_37_8]